jgi:hypothetical protein
MRGPIDYIVVGFEGNKFDGSILKALSDAIDKKIISLVALAVVSKDAEGTVSTLDIAELGDEYLTEFTQTYKPSNDLINSEDTDEVADLIENNCTAGLLAIEHLWAKPLKEALINANGVLIAEGRIHPDANLELNQEEA